jgi:hypothetical protein
MRRTNVFGVVARRLLLKFHAQLIRDAAKGRELSVGSEFHLG